MVNVGQRVKRVSLWTFGFCLLITASSGGVTPRGNRILAIDITEAEDGDWVSAFLISLGAGSQATDISLGWDDLEIGPGQYDGSVLTTIDEFFPSRGIPIFLTLAPTDTGQSRLPSYLHGRSFDDPVVIARFKTLLEFVFQKISNTELLYLAIGNEIDFSFGSDPVAWGRWQTFLDVVAEYARELRPGLRVGTKVTFNGLTGPAAGLAIASQGSSDTVMVTYYPLDSEFHVRDPSTVNEDLRRITEAFPGRKVAILEAGYPSSVVNQSSEERQRQFVTELFTAWDEFADQIELISLAWLTDLSHEQVAYFMNYYGLTDPAFGEFLRSLGLRFFGGSGVDKPAFIELKRQAALRGWEVSSAGGCLDSLSTLCLKNGRFQLQLAWTNFVGESGIGRVVPIGTDDSGLFWFFDAANWEMLVKVIDGCSFNDSYWVFAAATTNVAYELSVTDTSTGETRLYSNQLGVSSPALTDTTAFKSCP